MNSSTHPPAGPPAGLNTLPAPAAGLPGSGDALAGIHTPARARGLPVVTLSGAGARSISLWQMEVWRFALLTVVLVVVAFVISSCTHVQGNRVAGTYSYSSFAGNAKFGQLGPEGIRGGEIDNATGAGIIERTADKAANAWMWGKAWEAAGNLVDRGFDALEDGNATDEAINASDNAADVAKETFVPPPVEAPSL